MRRPRMISAGEVIDAVKQKNAETSSGKKEDTEEGSIYRLASGIASSRAEAAVREVMSTMSLADLVSEAEEKLRK